MLRYTCMLYVDMHHTLIHTYSNMHESPVNVKICLALLVYCGTQLGDAAE